MALFRRKKNDVEAVPAEVQDYYRSERRERAGLAWLLALGTLVATLIIAATLFFGGRWAYRKITGNDNKPNTATTQQQQQGTDQNQQGGNTSSTNTGAQNPPGNTGGAASTTPPAETPAPSTPQSTPAPPSTPNTGSSELVNTGPGDMVAIFVVTAVAGAIAHHVVWVRRKL